MTQQTNPVTGRIQRLIASFERKSQLPPIPETVKSSLHVPPQPPLRQHSYETTCPKFERHPSITHRSSRSSRSSMESFSPDSASPLEKLSWLKARELDQKEQESIERHRNPKFPTSTYKQTSLSNTHAAKRLEELIALYQKENGKKPDMRALARLKEQATQWAYDNHMETNIKIGLYNPGIVTSEIQLLLEVTPEAPFGKTFTTKQQVMEEIEEHLKRFSIPTFEKAEGLATSKKTSQVLTVELHDKLKHDIEEIFDLYSEVYPEASLLKIFMFCRDLVSISVYQVMFDKTIFTGSDHGVLHIHHNISNSSSIVKGIQESEVDGELQTEDVTLKQELLIRVMHFYHDIGYTVGASDFNVKKDHPFIGADVIEKHRAYFEYYLGKEETDILKTAILYHAIVSFDVDVDSDLSMVRFITSNADACAVAADEKSQSFWRENPAAITQLIRLRTLLAIYPEMAKKLNHPNILVDPSKVFALKDPQKTLTEDNFVNPVEFVAWTVFSKVKADLMAIAQHEALPEEEKLAFIQAIEESFNAFSGDIVLSQYGAALQEVSAVLNTEEKGGPKYKPAIDIAPSLLFAYLETLCSKDLAAGNIRKLCCSEYAANAQEVDRLLDEVGFSQDPSAKVTVPSAVAQITISKLEPATRSQTEEARWKSNVRVIEDFLKSKLPKILPAQMHKEFLGIIEDEKISLVEKGIALLSKAAQLDTPEKKGLIKNLKAIQQAVKAALQKTPSLSKEQQTRFELMLKTACSLDSEWEEIGVPRPRFTE